MNKTLLRAISAHAAQEYPRECCGLIVKQLRGHRKYVPCRNIARTPSEHFVLDPQDYAAAEDAGTVEAVVHSHPDTPARPSMADRVSCELNGLPWYVISWPEGDLAEIQPEGYSAPLVGREFAHGVLDCWSLCRDWYAREWGLELPNYPRRDLWWEEGESLYEQHYQAAGFYPVEVADIRRGDMIVMQIRAPQPNHAGIYLGDGTLASEPTLHAAPGTMLHHLYGRRSARDVFGGYWLESTRLVLRHKQAPEVPPCP
ncbi:C40 family peptidase [Pseudomonas sp. NPDC086581]|uniref:C40 family peptidase n=1 Tax=Pseudomonas sp. NPDC086581 TaxID=3364432 RepID=UPI0037F8BDBF